MKLKNLTYKLGMLICTLVIFTSCGEDRSGELKELTEVQHWIYDTMEEWYYWYEELPERKDIRFTDKPELFFHSLLSDKDGTKRGPFSYVEDKSEIPVSRSIHQTQYSYGIAFTPIEFTGNSKSLGVFINYVAKNSPAEEAGLDRGDLILSIRENGNPLTPEDINTLIGAGALQTVTFLRPPFKEGQAPLKQTSLPPARAIVDKPTYLAKNLGNGIGYLVYNHFTPGDVDRNARDLSFNQDLHDQIAGNLLGTKDLILDLRYNNGGYVSCAELLMALIGPRQIKNQSVGYMKYNDKKVAENPNNYQPLILATAQGNLDNDKSSVNLDIERLFVITSQNTASASEIIINSLNPFIPVYVIGETTVGKNVGSIGFDKGNWHIQPIVCQIYNSSNFTDYQEGFQPGRYYQNNFKANPEWEISEIEELFAAEEQSRFGRLGEIDEPLLAQVMNIIHLPDAISQTPQTRNLYSNIKTYPMIGLHPYDNLIVSKQ